MDTVKLTIDAQAVNAPIGATILEAARQVDIYIPALCYHPNLPPAKGITATAAVFQGQRKIVNAKPEEVGQGCGICVVEIEGYDELIGACATEVQEGMVVRTNNASVAAKRRENLAPIMTRHPHACLTCAQQEGCPRTQCSLNVAENERCCSLFGDCELQKVAKYIGILDSTPKWVATDLRIFTDHPLFERDYNLCIGCTRCVRACRELRGIEALGFVYDHRGQVFVGTLAETLEESGCKFCTTCVEVCPTGALVDKAVDAGAKEDDLVPCESACPVRIDIPSYIRMIAQNRTNEANAVIREKVPFPGVLGRVCTHPCEDVCRRGEVNESIAICALKRYAADGDKGLWKIENKVRSGSGKKVAVVGAGPGGLTAAYYLRKQGHAVSIFDSNRQPGGMMHYGIPHYRLPRDILDQEIKDILDLGIEFNACQTLGQDFSLDQLKKEGYDAVFLSVGAQHSRRLPLEGCNAPDVLWGVEFLRRVAKGENVELKDSVVVIGGGNVAIDVAMTALRCGATDVKIACLEREAEMPANPWKRDEAKAEGVEIMPSWGPNKIISEYGKISCIDLVECVCAFNDNGDFCPKFGDRKECIQVDQVIVSVGQAADLFFLENNSQIRTDKGLISVDEDTLETGIPGVYAGGDVVKLPGSLIQAIAFGRQAAAAIDQALGGTGEIDEVLFPRGNPDPYLRRDEGFASWKREKVPEQEVETRIKNFNEVTTGYSNKQAVREAKRCLQCDLRLQLGCNPVPPQDWLSFDEQTIRRVPPTEGVFQLLDGDCNVLAIKGTIDLRHELLIELEKNDRVVRFNYEEDKMFSRRESELIQKYVQKHGEMPRNSADDIDDLF